jgi:hypothetical protein
MKNGAGDTKTIRYMPPAGNYGDLSHLDVTQYVIPAGYAVWWRCTIAAWNGTRLMNYTLR